jgi:hypothetical protein
MPLKPTRKYEDKETPFQEQGYLARVVQIVDLGKQPQTDWKTKEEKDAKYEVFITLEFPDVRNDDNLPMWLSKRFQFPLAWPEKTGLKNNTNLYALFRELVPKGLTQSERFPDYWFMDDNIWEKLLNQPAYVEVAYTNTGAPKIKSIAKVPSFAGKVPPLENPVLLFEAASASLDDWDKLFGFVKKMLLNALDDETRLAAQKLDNQERPEQEEEEAPPAKKTKGKKKEETTSDPDDDLPF